MSTFQLCWDCKKAIGGCRWSDYGRPVKGWEADLIKPNGTKPYTTYMIHSCPEFVRDGYDGGTRREKREIKL